MLHFTSFPGIFGIKFVVLSSKMHRQKFKHKKMKTSKNKKKSHTVILFSHRFVYYGMNFVVNFN